MQVVILIGLPGSGKTTFYRQRFSATHVHVSRDNFPNNRNPTRRQAVLVEDALAGGRNVVVDNTNVRVADRRVIIEQARRRGAEVVGYFFEPDIAACRTRNRLREGQARVPDVAVYAAAKRFDAPSTSEGFDRLFRVRISNGMDFECLRYGV